MIQPIGAILNSKLSTLTWLERRGGVVVNAVRPAFVTGADGAQIRTGEEVYPVACGTSDDACWNGGKYKFFTPDAGVSAVSFFRDSGGDCLRFFRLRLQAFRPCLLFRKFRRF